MHEHKRMAGVGKKEGVTYDAFSRRTEKRRQDNFPSRLPCGGELEERAAEGWLKGRGIGKKAGV